MTVGEIVNELLGNRFIRNVGGLTKKPLGNRYIEVGRGCMNLW